MLNFFVEQPAKLFVATALCSSLILSGCGFLSNDSDNDANNGQTPVDQFNLNGDESTKIDAAALKSLINSEDLLGTIKIDQLLKFAPAASSLSRMNRNEFRACIAKRIADAPVSKTTDTISIQYNIDLIAACDETPKADDKVSELSNQIIGKLTVTCPGAGFSDWEENTWGEASNKSLESSCKSGRQIKFASSYEIKARKAWKELKRDNTEVSKLSVQVTRASLTALDGSPCDLSLENKIWTLQSCRKIEFSRTYEGAPEFEGTSPNATATERPVVQQSEINWTQTKNEEGYPYNHAGNTTFTFNGWTGSLVYTNGWAAPKWTAVRGGDKADGTLKQ